MELQNATSLNLVFDDPNNEFGPFRTQIEENIQFAWNQWDVFIDADPNASIELTVLPSNDTGSTVASASSPFINGAAHGVVGTELINGVDNNGSSSDGSIEISIDFLSEFHYNLDSTASGDKINFGDVITHELGHVLGYSSSIPDLLQTAYGSLVDEVDGTFIGEHATAVNGGPVSLQGGSLSHLDRSSFPSSIMSPVALRGGNLDISHTLKGVFFYFF